MFVNYQQKYITLRAWVRIPIQRMNYFVLPLRNSYVSTMLVARTEIRVYPNTAVRTEGLQKGVPIGKATAADHSDQALLSVTYFF